MQLFVRTPGGDATPVTVDGDCTIKQLKMIVENETFVPQGPCTLPSNQPLQNTII